VKNRKAVPIVRDGKKAMGGGADDDSTSPLFYSCSNSLSTVTTPENSKATVTPEQYPHFPGQKKRHQLLFSERRMPQKWLKHGLFQPSVNLFLLAEPLSQHAPRQ